MGAFNNWVSTHNKTMTLYIVFEKELWLFYYNDGFALRHSLFGAVKLTKNIDPDSYSYSGYGISLIYVQLFHFWVVGVVRMW